MIAIFTVSEEMLIISKLMAQLNDNDSDTSNPHSTMPIYESKNVLPSFSLTPIERQGQCTTVEDYTFTIRFD